MANKEPLQVAPLPEEEQTEEHGKQRVVKTNHLIQEFTTALTTEKDAITAVNMGLMKGARQRKQVQSGQMYIAIDAPNIRGLNLRPSAQKLFRLINAEVTASGYQYGDTKQACRVYIPLEEAMALCGATNEQAFIRTWRADLKTLRSVYITEEFGKYSFLDINLGSSGAYDEGTRQFVFTVTGEAMHVLFNQRSSIMPLHGEVFKINAQKHRAAWSIADKLINYRWANPEKEHQLVISVVSLLEACASSLPSEEKLKEQRASTKAQIVKPFVAALNHLAEDVDVLDYWDFCHEGGKDLTEDEQQALLDEHGNETVLPDYGLFKTLYIRYALAHDNEAFRLKRLEGRAKARLEAKAVKELKEEEKKKSRNRVQRGIEKGLIKAGIEEELSKRKAENE